MLNLYINRVFSCERLRTTLYSGGMILYSGLAAPAALCRYAQSCIGEAFGAEQDPRYVHHRLSVEEFVGKVVELKRLFTNSLPAKQHIRDFLREIGQDPQDFYFDVPRLRVVPHYDYLHAGVSYAYLPHRDTWYGAADCQLNTWMPVFEIEPDQTMMINPGYFDRPVRNTSGDWDLAHWIRHERPAAQSNIAAENRAHPVPLEPVSEDGELRLAGRGGDLIMFSGAHLHATVPNRSDQVRYSVDFRVLHRGDIAAGLGARNLDAAARNKEAGYRDLFRASDFKPYLETLQ